MVAAEPEQALPGKAEHHVFPAEKHSVNAGLVAHGGAQK